MFKRMTHIPCPACGSTRAANALLHGNLDTAFYLNPLGFIIAFLMIALPLWICYDLLSNKKTLFHAYYKVEENLKQKRFALPAILLILANWTWNIYKDL